MGVVAVLATGLVAVAGLLVVVLAVEAELVAGLVAGWLELELDELGCVLEVDELGWELDLVRR